MSPAAKTCSTPGCPNLRPCDLHPKVAWQGSQRRSELPPDWNRRARTVLRRNELHNDGLCQDGRVCGGLSLAREVHHPGDPSDHSIDQLEAVCHACHAASTNRQAVEARSTGRINP